MFFATHVQNSGQSCKFGSVPARKDVQSHPQISSVDGTRSCPLSQRRKVHSSARSNLYFARTSASSFAGSCFGRPPCAVAGCVRNLRISSRRSFRSCFDSSWDNGLFVFSSVSRSFAQSSVMPIRPSASSDGEDLVEFWMNAYEVILGRFLHLDP